MTINATLNSSTSGSAKFRDSRWSVYEESNLMQTNDDYRNVDRIPALVERLYAIVDELETLFPGRRFTPDGHMVGSLGEVLAAHRYGLKLLPASAKRHDAMSQDGGLVQIKTTQGTRVALSSEPDYLVVLLIIKNGSVEPVFNGPGSIVWEGAGSVGKNGQRPISLAKLRSLMSRVPESLQLSVLNE